MLSISTKSSLVFDYTNYKGEKSHRRAQPIRIFYGRTSYHMDYQWFLLAFDEEKNSQREFAMHDMTNVKEVD